MNSVINYWNMSPLDLIFKKKAYSGTFACTSYFLPDDRNSNEDIDPNVR